MLLDPDGKTSCSPLLGSGGNEGRLEYGRTFMDDVCSLLISSDVEVSGALLRNALFGKSTQGLEIASVGQFDPGRAGGFNQGPGIESKDFPTNQWDFILAMEGAIAWSGDIGRRSSLSRHTLFRYPFSVRTSPVGYSSETQEDGKEARAEIWVPIWSKPVGYQELRSFLAEGRSDVGRKWASNGLEFAEAIAGLGVDRGVNSFLRYGLLKRRGDNYVALPMGQFPVKARKEADLARELETVLGRLDSYLRRMGSVPARLESARNQIDQETYQMLLHGGSVHVKAVLRAVGRMEYLLSQQDMTAETGLKAPLTVDLVLTG